MHAQHNPPYKEQAEAIADLAERKFKTFYNLNFITDADHGMAALSLNELADIYMTLGNTSKNEWLLFLSEGHRAKSKRLSSDYICKVPIEIFNIIKDFADTPGFLPSIEQIHLQNNPPYKKQAEAIAELGRGKISLQPLYEKYSNSCRSNLICEQAVLSLMSQQEGSSCSMEFLKTLLSISKSYYLLGDVKEAQETLLQVETTVSSLPNSDNSKSKTMCEIAYLYFTMGNFEKAKELLDKAEAMVDMSDQGVADHLKRISDLYFELGMKTKAKELLEIAKEAISAVSDHLYKANFLAHLSYAYSDMKKFDTALILLKEAEKSLGDPKKITLLKEHDCFFLISRAYVYAKNLHEAERVANLILERDNAYLLIVEAYAKADNVADAKRVAAMILSSRIQKEAFEKLK
jgi:tetratricopeptide (TPR) repeat protein